MKLNNQEVKLYQIGLKAYLGLLRSKICNSAPPTLPWSGSTVEFMKRIVMFVM